MITGSPLEYRVAFCNRFARARSICTKSARTDVIIGSIRTSNSASAGWLANAASMTSSTEHSASRGATVVRLEPRQVQEIIDQPRQPSAFINDQPSELIAFIRRQPRVAHRGACGDHRGHGRAQVV